MLTEVKLHIKLVLMSLKYNLIKSMDNKMAFIGQVLGMVINNAIMIIQWIVLFSLKDTIGDYTFDKVLLLWAISASSYGFAHLIFNNTYMLSNLIVGGKLDAFLVQPKDTLVYLSTSSISVSAIGDLLYGFIVLIVLKASIITWLLFILFTICGGLILSGVSVIANSLSFWFSNMEDFANLINSNMVNLGTYPDGIFSNEVRWLLLTILPVAFTVHLPVELMTTFNLNLFITLVFFTILIVIIAYKVFYSGLKKYSSSNLMSSRI